VALDAPHVLPLAERALRAMHGHMRAFDSVFASKWMQGAEGDRGYRKHGTPSTLPWAEPRLILCDSGEDSWVLCPIPGGDVCVLLSKGRGTIVPRSPASLPPVPPAPSLYSWPRPTSY